MLEYRRQLNRYIKNMKYIGTAVRLLRRDIKNGIYPKEWIKYIEQDRKAKKFNIFYRF